MQHLFDYHFDSRFDYRNRSKTVKTGIKQRAKINIRKSRNRLFIGVPGSYARQDSNL